MIIKRIFKSLWSGLKSATHLPAKIFKPASMVLSSLLSYIIISNGMGSSYLLPIFMNLVAMSALGGLVMSITYKEATRGIYGFNALVVALPISLVGLNYLVLAMPNIGISIVRISMLLPVSALVFTALFTQLLEIRPIRESEINLTPNTILDGINLVAPVVELNGIDIAAPVVDLNSINLAGPGIHINGVLFLHGMPVNNVATAVNANDIAPAA